MTGRLDDLRRFYEILESLEAKLGGKRRLSECSQSLRWPERGVYVFVEPGENRSDSGTGPRVVWVGTHAVTAGASTTLWHRLLQHRGTLQSGGGNHRGSVFRLLVGNAIRKRNGWTAPATWGIKKAAEQFGLSRDQIVAQEHELEVATSGYIGSMPFLWIDVNDAPGRKSRRGYIEWNSIALLSNYHRPPLDAASVDWLGRHSDRDLVRQSGLWNNQLVVKTHEQGFLALIENVL